MKRFRVITMLALLSALFAHTETLAQSAATADVLYGEIAGRVLDAETREPLAFVNVYLDSTRIGAATALDGSFLLKQVPPGKYRLHLSRLGYEPMRLSELVLAPGKLFSRDFFMRESPLAGQEVTITAARKEQTAQMAPASVAILNAAELKYRQIATFDQALETVPGVAVMRSASTNVQSLSIRGSSDVAGGGVGNRVLLLIDGRPALTSDAGGALWSLVPTNFIDRVEIVKGAFSSLYGSTAMGGVVNVITRRPTYQRQTRVEATYGIYELPAPGLRYNDEPGYLNALGLSHSGRKKHLSYLLNFSRKQSTGFRERSAYEFYDLYGKLLYDFRENRNLELSLGATSAENDYPHTWLDNLQPYRVIPRYQDDRQEKLNYNADVFYWAVPSPRAKYSSRFYFYRNRARSFFNENEPNWVQTRNDPFGLRTKIDADKLGNITQLDWSMTPAHYLILGVDTQIDRVQSSPDSIMYGDRQVNNFAAYVQDEITATTQLTLTAGLRLDHNVLVHGKRQSQVSPKLAAVYQLRDNISLRALAGQAFRAPSIAERFFQEEISGGTSFVPNPNLKAERMNSFELGGRGHLGKWFEIDAAYFHYRYRDMIYWIALPQEIGQFEPWFQVRNLNRALMQGYEVGVNFYWQPRLQVRAAYTYLDANDRSENRTDDLLAYRIRHAFNFGASWRAAKYELGFDGRYTGRVEEVFLYPNDEPKAYVLLNAKATARFLKGFAFSASCNNLLDTQYEELARYRMPGRHWVTTASWEF